MAFAVHNSGAWIPMHSRFTPFEEAGDPKKTYTSLNVNGEMLRIVSSTSSGRNGQPDQDLRWLRSIRLR
jgi:hypothetical protein